MSSQCTNDGTYTLTVTFKLGIDLNMAQVLVQNRVALAMPVLPDLVNRNGVDGEEEVAQRADDRQPVLARRQPRQPLPEQLRHDPDPRRAGPAAGRGRHHLPRPARLQHAALARSGEAGLAQPDRQRRGRRRPAAERPGGRRPDRPAAGARRAGLPVHHDHAGPARSTPSSSATSILKTDDRRGRLVRMRDVARIELGRPGLRPDLHARRPAVGRPCRSTSCPAPTP